jgi:hypothetical protein
MFLARPRFVATAILLCVLLAPRNGASSIGSWFRQGARNLVTSALAPSIQKFWGGAHDLAADLDQKIDKQLKTAASLTQQVVAQTDTALANRIGQVDRSLEARILQVDTSANALVRNALGEVDEISRRRIDQLGAVGTGLVKQLDATAQKTLRQADVILEARIDQLGTLVGDAVRQADAAIEARIDQLDEVAGRRLGNIDVIVTKQRLGLEQTLTRVAAIVGLLAFAVYAMQRLWQGYASAQRDPGYETAGRFGRVGLYRRHMGPPLLKGIAAAAVGVGVLHVAYQRLPLGADRQLHSLIAEHAAAYDASLASFDFTRARFHASQLEILDPAAASQHKARAAKADLFRLVFATPTVFASPEGQGAIAGQVSEIEALLGERADPDLLTVRAFVLWQTGEGREDEHVAASLCARALRLAPRGFPLAPLARNYVRAYLHAPYVGDAVRLGRDSEPVEVLRRLAAADDSVPDGFPLAHALAYNVLLQALDRSSTAAYLDMLKAHAGLVVARDQRDEAVAAAAKRQRLEAAREILRAWRAFDAGLRELPALERSASILAVFTLNDAVLVHALWFIERPETDELPPPLASIGSKPADVDLKVRLAPPRIAWARRYAAVIGSKALDVLEFEEAKRFERFEAELREFEQAYVSTLTNTEPTASEPASDQKLRAAIAAARLGLYVDSPEGRLPLATKLWPAQPLAHPTVAADMDEFHAAQAARVLRFL